MAKNSRYTTDLVSLLSECTENHDVWAEDSEGEEIDGEWPNNSISRFAKFDFENGIFQRSTKNPKKPVSQEEVDLCRRLANEASEVFGDGDIGLGSESLSTGMAPFWLVAIEGEFGKKPVPQRIHEELVRDRFSQYLFTPISIDVEKLEIRGEGSRFWQDLVDYYGDDPSDPESDIEAGSQFRDSQDPPASTKDKPKETTEDEDEDEGFHKWKRIIKWFNSKTEFKDVVFVKIGVDNHLWNLPKRLYPHGTEMTPSALPRLLLGLTEKGSLVGLFSYIVST